MANNIKSKKNWIIATYINIVLNSVHEHVTVASIEIIYVNLLDFIIYLDTASII